MYRKLWKLEQLQSIDSLDIPDVVLQAAKEKIRLLGEYYGVERDVDAELGGFVTVFTPQEKQKYQDFLNTYHLEAMATEYAKTLCCQKGFTWQETLFQCSSDYAIILLHPDFQIE